jgi:TPP-dependent pyruvate/acetoin dehydrogenase alpha subunit
VQKLNAEQFWKLIESTLKNEREAAAIENYTMEKKARQIRLEYPHLFADINSVYRTKENLMKRWRRDPNLKAWYTGGGK